MGNGTLDIGIWQHYVFTRESNGTSVIYKNGELLKSGNSNVPQTGGGNMVIGKSSLLSKAQPMLLNDLRDYDGLLTPAEISQLYTSEKEQYK